MQTSVTSTIERYDILVLGSGEPGKYIAWTLAKAGRRAAVVERGLIGGSCPNIACLPSKNVIHSARVAKRWNSIRSPNTWLCSVAAMLASSSRNPCAGSALE